MTDTVTVLTADLLAHKYIPSPVAMMTATNREEIASECEKDSHFRAVTARLRNASIAMGECMAEGDIAGAMLVASDATLYQTLLLLGVAQAREKLTDLTPATVRTPRASKDPWDIDWVKQTDLAVCEAFAETLREKLPGILARANHEKKGAPQDAIPNAGAPVSISALLDDYEAAPSDEAFTALYASWAMAHGKATTLRVVSGEAFKIKAIGSDGTVLIKDRNGAPAVRGIACGFRIDSLRVSKPKEKKTEVAPDAVPAPSEIPAD